LETDAKQSINEEEFFFLSLFKTVELLHRNEAWCAMLSYGLAHDDAGKKKKKKVAGNGCVRPLNC
jgi:hypothetical protein